MDEQKFNDFLNRFVGDLGATVGAGAVVLGDQLGLYRTLAEGPQTPDVLAAKTETAARYVEEWLRGQAAGGYVAYDAASGTYHLTDEQVFALTDPDGPVFLPGAFQLALGTLHAVPRLAEAFRTGEGVGWHEHDEDVFVGCEQFFRPGYSANLVTEWLPALDGVVAKLESGAKVADVGCGLGASTTLMAQAFPNSTLHRLRLPRRLRRAGTQERRGARAGRPGGVRDRRGDDVHRAPATTSSRRSTACTTWAIPWRPRCTSGSSSTTGAPG